MAQRARDLASEVRAAIYAHGVVLHPVTQTKVFAYEVDGFGNHLFMDDANVPSLLSLPLLGFVNSSDPLYAATRRALLNGTTNPYYFSGQAGAGIGGPHVGPGNIWPMSLMVQALTSDNATEVHWCLDVLKNSSAGTGVMHESFSKGKKKKRRRRRRRKRRRRRRWRRWRKKEKKEGEAEEHKFACPFICFFSLSSSSSSYFLSFFFVDNAQSYTRPWFSWANSLFAQTVMDIGNRFPGIIFGSRASNSRQSS